jgi:arylsulfatase A-like enzyme
MIRVMRSCRALLSVALLLGACTPEPPVGRDVVVARVGGEPSVRAVSPPARIVPIKLETLTRNAVVADPGTSFEVSVDPPAARLAFSTAASAAKAGDATARFRIDQRDGDAWEPLYDDVDPGDARWRDHHIDLPASSRPAVLRFSTSAEPRREGGAADPATLRSAAFGSIVFSAPAADDDPRAAPSVVLVVIDTLGADYLSAFDNVPGVSPHIDAFLAQGHSFRRAYAQYGNTLVSHASLFSARQPVSHGIYPGAPMRPLDESLVAVLAAAGYHTVAFTEGAFVSANFGFSVGFDHYDDGLIGISAQMAGGAAQTFEHAGAWLAEHGARERFLLFVHTYEVHAPYSPRDAEALRVARRITPGDGRLFAPEQQARRSLLHNSGDRLIPPRDLARLRALHSAEIHTLDRVFGDFLARIARLGLERDTLVVLTADHGDQFGEHGKVGHSESLHNRVLHVPLALRWPGVIVPGETRAPVQLVDVMPTVLDLLGLETPDARDGRSLTPWLRGAGELRPAFSEQRSSRGECLRLELPPHCRLDRFAVQTERFKLVTSRVPAWEHLYDLRDDPLETRDVAAEHPEEVARHRALLAGLRAAAKHTTEDVAPTPLDADTRERLRELGYID